MEYIWVQHGPHAGLPPFAVIGGHDCDGSPIYVGRAFHEGNNLPAKVIPSKNTAYICWGSGEHSKSHYEILVGQHYSWVPCCNGNVPPNAVRTGCTSTGEPLYVGRGHWENSLTVGKIHQSHGCLYIPFGGHERRLDTYEVLVDDRRANGIASAPNYMPPKSVVVGYETDGSNTCIGRGQHEGYKWVHSSTYAGIPPNAVVGGNDSDGSVIYVGRCFHNGDMLCAKVIPSKKSAYVSWRGQEISKDHFEILCGHNLVWRHCHDHVIPENAVLCGKTSLEQAVYVGRGHFEGSLTVGRVSSVHRALFIPYGGMERRLDRYEVLIAENRDPGWAICPPYPPVTTSPTAPPQPTAGYTWIECNASYTPPNAVYAGHESDMTPIFVGRAFHVGQLLPAKVIPNRGSAYVSFSGQEVRKHQYEVLVGDAYHWVHAQDGNVPPGAIAGGHTASGETLFIGRAHYSGSLTPGRVHRSQRCLLIAFAGLEQRITHYEVLVGKSTYYHAQGIKMQCPL